MSECHDILVLHGIRDLSNERRTSVRHLFALQRYTQHHRFVYHYVEDPITDALRSIPFSVIILDCTFLGWRWARPRQLFRDIRARYDDWLRSHDALIMAFPQDDFDHSTYLDQWLADLGTRIVYCVYRQNIDKLYPRVIAKNIEIIPSLAAYIDEDELTEFAALRKPFRERSIDVGYRVRRLLPHFGRLGVLKSEFGRVFARHAGEHLRCDISDAEKDFIYGEEWLRFLGDARFTLGCESGSSVLDPEGEVRDRVAVFIAENPAASWEEIAAASIKPENELWVFPALSPRIFESAMAGNCPILIEGDYEGLITPNEHFIPVKRDFSDIGEAIERLADLDGAEQMAARFQDQILGDPRLRYKSWVETAIEPKLLANAKARSDRLSDWEFAFRVEQHRSAIIGAKAEENNRIRETMRVTVNEVNSQREWLLGILESERKQAAGTIEFLKNRPAWRLMASQLKARMPGLAEAIYPLRVHFYRLRVKLGIARTERPQSLPKEIPPSEKADS